MIVSEVRSGVVEAQHPVSLAAIDSDGEVVLSFGGDLDRPFFMRSAAKPFQAFVSQACGADLGVEQLAVASASHGGQPIHVAYVSVMLSEVGLDETALMCPPAWPSEKDAATRAGRSRRIPPAAIYHNCSGKHAAMLRACVASGWSTDYVDRDHPLQRRVLEHIGEVTRGRVEPVGVDGCGVPTLRTDVMGLARAFSALAGCSDLAPVAGTMRRFGALTSDGDREEAVLTRWLPAAVKGGARGCVGLAWPEGGVGVAAKAWSGDHAAAMVGLVEALERLQILSGHPRVQLEGVARPAVTGGGRTVGSLRPLVV